MADQVLWEVVGGAEKGGILVRTGRGKDSPVAAERLAHGTRVREVELDGERLLYERVSGTGPNSGWVSTKLGSGSLLLDKVVPLWEVVGGADKGGIVVRSGFEVQSPQESTRLSTGALVAELALQGDRLCYRRLSGTGPDTGWVSTRLQNRTELMVRSNRSLRDWEVGRTPSEPSSSRRSAPVQEASAVVAPAPDVLELGLLTNPALANASPVFVVLADRVSVRELAAPDSEEVGVVCSGDLVVADGDLDLLPWVKLPARSRVRRCDSSARTQLLEEDAFFCAEVISIYSKPRRVALRCADRCAAVHLSSCADRHWKAVHSMVLIVEGPSEQRKRAGLLEQGDIVFLGASARATAGATSSSGWLRMGPDSLVWKRRRQASPDDAEAAAVSLPMPAELLLAPAAAALEGGRTEGFVLEVHSSLGTLVAPVEVKGFEEGPDLAVQSVAAAEEERVEAARVKAAVFELWGPLEVRTDPLPDPELNPEEAWTALRCAEEQEAPQGAWRPWIVAGGSSTGLLSSRSLEPDAEPLLPLRRGDVLLQSVPTGKRLTAGLMWMALEAGDKIYRSGHVLARVCDGKVWVMLCDRSGLETLQPLCWEDSEAVLVEECSGFGEPWAIVREEDQSMHSAPADPAAGTPAPAQGFALPGDVLGEGTLARAVPDEERLSLGDERLLLSPSRRGVYQRVAEICHRRIWADNLEALWNGDRKRLLPLGEIEAKILSPGVTVLHARRAGRFVGGAIVRSIPVKTFPWLHITGTKIQYEEDPESENTDAGYTKVAYVDCCATERGSRAGRALWKAVTELPCVAVALHSVLLPEALDFWRSCGMEHLDANDQADQYRFLTAVQSSTGGKVNLVLPELVKELPQHSLPLFLWAKCM